MDKKSFLEILSRVLCNIGFQKTKSTNYYAINDSKNEMKIILMLQHSNYGKYYYLESQFIFDDEIIWDKGNIKNQMIWCRLVINPNEKWKKDELDYDKNDQSQIINLLENVEKSILPYIKHGKSYLREQILKNKKGFWGSTEIQSKYLGIEQAIQPPANDDKVLFKEYVTYQIVNNLMYVMQNYYEKDIAGWENLAKEKNARLKIVKPISKKST